MMKVERIVDIGPYWTQDLSMVKFMVIIAILAAQAGTAQVARVAADRPLLKLAWLRSAPPTKIADAVLSEAHPPMARADILPGTGGQAASGIALYGHPARLDRGFCRAQSYNVALVPLEYTTDPSPDGPPYRASGATTAAVYRVSASPEACEPDTRGYFPISGGADADGRSLVRALIGIKAAAQSGARIPPVTCLDRSNSGGCAGGSRALLAGLRTDAIGNVALAVCTDRRTGVAKPCGPEIWLGASGGEAAYWVVSPTLRGRGRNAGIAQIALVRERVVKAPPPR